MHGDFMTRFQFMWKERSVHGDAISIQCKIWKVPSQRNISTFNFPKLFVSHSLGAGGAHHQRMNNGNLHKMLTENSIDFKSCLNTNDLFWVTNDFRNYFLCFYVCFHRCKINLHILFLFENFQSFVLNCNVIYFVSAPTNCINANVCPQL